MTQVDEDFTQVAERPQDNETVRNAYLDLIKRCLINSIYEDTGKQVGTYSKTTERLLNIQTPMVRRIVQFVGGVCVNTMPHKPFDDTIREEGRDFPALAHTMIGRRRLDNLQQCVQNVLANDVPGDLIETGVWRGGASIFMRALLKAHGDTVRGVWAADSFEGLPKPNGKRYRSDVGNTFHKYREMAVSLEEVKQNFARYGLLDDQVHFLKGWFRDTLPTAPIESLSILRLDGDMYESTMDGLVHLYPKLSVGGYVIVDDYGGVPMCREAIDDFRRANGISDPIQQIDWSGVYWQRSG